MSRLTLILVIVTACAHARHRAPTSLSSVAPTPPHTTWDSVIAVSLEYAVSRGIPEHWWSGLLIVQADSAFMSSSSLPHSSRVTFALLDSARVQQVANRFGDYDVLMVIRSHLESDTAVATIASRRVYQRRNDRFGQMNVASACELHLRRLEAGWQVDSVFICMIT